jgi:hypothetical protein
MKRKIFAVVALSILCAAGAFAGKGGPIIAGSWAGLGQAIYMDGTTAEISVDFVSVYQKGNFVYGDSQFTVTIGGGSTQTLPGQLSGYIQGNLLKGAFGMCMLAAPDCVGAAVFEGKISGNMLSGTIIDLSDGSTSAVTLYRMAD